MKKIISLKKLSGPKDVTTISILLFLQEAKKAGKTFEELVESFSDSSCDCLLFWRNMLPDWSYVAFVDHFQKKRWSFSEGFSSCLSL